MVAGRQPPRWPQGRLDWLTRPVTDNLSPTSVGSSSRLRSETALGPSGGCAQPEMAVILRSMS